MAEKTTIARPYAQAAFNLAQAAGDLKVWSDMLQLMAMVAEHGGMKALIGNPSVKREQLVDLIIDICGDNLNEAGKKIIYSSSMQLAKIPKMSEQLKSRIAVSLISEIEPPDFRTRVKILQHKARGKVLRVPSEVIEFMASELKQNVRILPKLPPLC